VDWLSTEASPRSNGRVLYALRRGGAGSDEALCAIAARGDRGAFGAVYERHHEALYRYCHSILGHHDDAFDAVHNAMLKAWEALLRDRPNAPLRPWLFRIAHNEAVTVLRRRHVHGRLDDVHAAAPRPLEETLDTRRRMDRLRSDLKALPERQRSALLLRELCGLRHDEIAVVLEISTATARQTIYEARLALHEAEKGRQLACAAVRRTLSDGDGRTRRGRKIRSHLRTCRACASFDEALRRRPGDLAALTPPLPGAAAAGLLGRLLWAHATSGGGSSAVGGAMGTAVQGAGSAVAQMASVIATTVTVGTVVAAGVGVPIAIERAATPPSARASAAAPPDGRGQRGVGLAPGPVVWPQQPGSRAGAAPSPSAAAGAPSGAAQSTDAGAPPPNDPATTTAGPSADRDASGDATVADTAAPGGTGDAAGAVASSPPPSKPVLGAPSRPNGGGSSPRPSSAPAGGSVVLRDPRPAPRPGAEPSPRAPRPGAEPSPRAPRRWADPSPAAARPGSTVLVRPAPNKPGASPIRERAQRPADAGTARTGARAGEQRPAVPQVPVTARAVGLRPTADVNAPTPAGASRPRGGTGPAGDAGSRGPASPPQGRRSAAPANGAPPPAANRPGPPQNTVGPATAAHARAPECATDAGAHPAGPSSPPARTPPSPDASRNDPSIAPRAHGVGAQPGPSPKQPSATPATAPREAAAPRATSSSEPAGRRSTGGAGTSDKLPPSRGSSTSPPVP
jgi:RNA polymerase sigma factor (sigma-70 family)